MAGTITLLPRKDKLSGVQTSLFHPVLLVMCSCSRDLQLLDMCRGQRDRSALEREDSAQESRSRKQQNQVLRLKCAQVHSYPDSTGTHTIFGGRNT